MPLKSYYSNSLESKMIDHSCFDNTRYPNLVEVRTIPGRSNTTFVEYVDATSSGVAKDALHNYKFDGKHKIKVTFAKQ
ncbi:hypothetical protein PSHT_16166 [Puccinia striiformis]|uniref:RRM domain-containing protein n=1 Tax=Puccinia striiformis TaxID=27350 RepID=A0A2S4UB64_9BASI|nr:hypothetical protein PSHT_16166 [Puccinia striiformis]